MKIVAIAAVSGGGKTTVVNVIDGSRELKVNVEEITQKILAL